MLTHVHIISTTLSGGAYSENVVLNQTELASILIIPTNTNNTMTFKITSPNSNIVFSAQFTGRFYREVKLPMSGTYTFQITGASVPNDTVNGEVGFRR